MTMDRLILRSTRYLGIFPHARGDAWMMLGQDGGQSIDLGDRTLFVFSDSLLHVKHGVQRSGEELPVRLPAGESATVLGNSAGIGRGGTLMDALAELQYFTDDNGVPREVIAARPEEGERDIRFWPEHGIQIDDRVYLFYLGIEAIDRRVQWAFRNLGTGLAVLDPSTGECQPVERDGSWRLWDAEADDFHFGVQVVSEGSYVYCFASMRIGWRTGARLARVKKDRIQDLSAYEYLLTADGEWGCELSAAHDLGECAPDYSVSFNPYLGRYTMVYVDGYSKLLHIRTAERIEGPYSEPQALIRVPHEPDSQLVYIAFEHPRYRAGDGKVIYVSYCQPHFTNNSLVRLEFR